MKKVIAFFGRAYKKNTYKAVVQLENNKVSLGLTCHMEERKKL